MSSAASTFETFQPLHVVASALEAGKLDRFQTGTGFGSCLIPLLSALNWRGNARHVAESLPHFIDDISLVELRNVLARLQLRTRSHETGMLDIDPRLLPCLYVTRDGDPLVLIAYMRSGIRVFDGRVGEERVIDGSEPAGTAYFVDAVDDSERASTRVSENWIGGIAARFRGAIGWLMGITLVLNLLALAVPVTVATIYDRVIGAHDRSFLIALCLGFVTLVFCEVGLRLVRSNLLAFIGGRIDYIVGTATLRRALFLPTQQTETAPIGAQMARFKEFETLREFFTGPLIGIVMDLPFAALFLLAVFLMGGPVAIVPALMIVVFLAAGLVSMPVLRHRAGRASSARATRHAFMVEMLSQLRSIKQTSAEATWFDRYREMAARSASNEFENFQTSAALQTIAQTFMTLAGIITLIVGAQSVIDGDMTVGALIAVMALVWRILAPFQLAFTSMTRFEQVRFCALQVNRLMRMTPERDPNTRSVARRKIVGEVSFARVALRYRPDHEPALLGVSFTVAPGEMVAITGPNGSGKSTLLKLTVGLYRPQAGGILIDGVDIRQMDPVELRHSISYVPQVNQLFHGSIAQNLRLSEPTASDEQLRHACRQAGVLDDILDLPEGLDTRIGDQKLQQMPSGFLQRISLARAFLQDNAIILFDEAGQLLDDDGDQAFVETLKSLKGRKTLIYVTHRPSHMRLADRLLVLRSGQLVMNGKPDEVLEQLNATGAA